MEKNKLVLDQELLNIRNLFKAMHRDTERTKSLYKEIVEKSKEVVSAYSDNELGKKEWKIGSMMFDYLATFFEQTKIDNEKLVKKPLLELTDKVLLFHFTNIIYSNILTFSQAKELIYLIDMPISTKWDLIYWAHRDGFGAKDFHYYCDNKPNILVIIKSENECIFGGYTQIGWNQTNNSGINDPNTFLFSLINKENKPIKMINQRPNDTSLNSVFYRSDAGPIFGNSYYSYDLYISDNSNSNEKSFSELSTTFINNGIASNILVGTKTFKVADIEVFQKI